jgi:hypothetical protein
MSRFHYLRQKGVGVVAVAQSRTPINLVEPNSTYLEAEAKARLRFNWTLNISIPRHGQSFGRHPNQALDLTLDGRRTRFSATRLLGAKVDAQSYRCRRASSYSSRDPDPPNPSCLTLTACVMFHRRRGPRPRRSVRRNRARRAKAYDEDGGVPTSHI